MSVTSQRALHTIRNWNQTFQVGTDVVYHGQPHRTWSPAGLGKNDEPSVWLEGIEEPVPIRALTVPGYEMTTGRR